MLAGPGPSHAVRRCCVEQSFLAGVSSVIRNVMTAEAFEDTGTFWKRRPRRPAGITHQWAVTSHWGKHNLESWEKLALALGKRQ